MKRHKFSLPFQDERGHKRQRWEICGSEEEKMVFQMFNDVGGAKPIIDNLMMMTSCARGDTNTIREVQVLVNHIDSNLKTNASETSDEKADDSPDPYKAMLNLNVQHDKLRSTHFQFNGLSSLLADKKSASTNAFNKMKLPTATQFTNSIPQDPTLRFSDRLEMPNSCLTSEYRAGLNWSTELERTDNELLTCAGSEMNTHQNHTLNDATSGDCMQQLRCAAHQWARMQRAMIQVLAASGQLKQSAMAQGFFHFHESDWSDRDNDKSMSSSEKKGQKSDSIGNSNCGIAHFNLRV